MTNDSSNLLSIYIHWPFCEAKCPYCDFNSHVVRQIDQDAWCASYLSELDRYAAEYPSAIIQSVFFGGGTPSLMDPATVSAILDRISQKWRLTNTVEVTLEANPSSVEAQRFRSYREAGVNRVSLGVQSLNDVDLKKLGRLHSAQEALAALDIARDTFERCSFDLIYGRQNQSVHAWEAELKQALTIGFDHLSLYQLTIEPGTAFGNRYKRGALRGLPSEDVSADMYKLTTDLCCEGGLPQYEVSNYARAGQESIHNLTYWNYTDYLGIGPGAHGRITLPSGLRCATETALNPQVWLKAVEAGSDQETRDVLSQEDQGIEMILMALRLRSGARIDRYRDITGQDLNLSRIQQLREQGIVTLEGGMLAVEPPYMAVLNTIINQVLPD